MHITPDIAAATYDYLRGLPIIASWGLPDSDEVEFHVVRAMRPRCFADATWKPNVIRLASSRIHHLQTLQITMAHEMVHLHLDSKGVKGAHGADFMRCARQLSKAYGFDPGWF